MTRPLHVVFFGVFALSSACGSKVDEKTLRRIVREEIQREAARRIDAKGSAPSVVAKAPTAARDAGVMGPPLGRTLPSSSLSAPLTPADLDRRRQERLQRQMERLHKRIERLAKRIEEYRKDGTRTPAQIARMERSLGRMKARLTRMRNDATDPTWPSRALSPPPPTTSGNPTPSEWYKRLAAGIRKVGPLAYEIDRIVFDQLFSNPSMMGRDARIVPYAKGGVSLGFRLYRVRRGGFFDALGLRSGDVVTHINSMAIDAADKMLTVYTKLRTASAMEIKLLRAGQVTTLTYKVK